MYPARRYCVPVINRLSQTGTPLVRHARYAAFQVVDVAIPRDVFTVILTTINILFGQPLEQHPHDQNNSKIRCIKRRA